jgi:hypothetical protein
MFPRPRRYTNRKIATNWSNTPLHIKLGISEAEMNADLALQARIHDYEERDREKAQETQSEAKLHPESSTKTEEEKAVADGDEKQAANSHDDLTKTSSESDVTAAVGNKVNEDSTTATRLDNTDNKATAPITTTVEKTTERVDDKRNEGGHTPGEAWTETPHFLWGP